MNILFKIKPVLYLLMLLLTALAVLSCEQQKQDHASTITPKCISSQNTCVINLRSGEFSILFNKDPVITDTPFDIFLVSDGRSIIKNISAHMEGKNMFMGKIPLFFDYLSDENKNQELNDFKVNVPESESIESNAVFRKETYIANTMLGSCSEENMRWIIYFTISLETTLGEMKTENFNIEFNSFRG